MVICNKRNKARNHTPWHGSDITDKEHKCTYLPYKGKIVLHPNIEKTLAQAKNKNEKTKHRRYIGNIS